MSADDEKTELGEQETQDASPQCYAVKPSMFFEIKIWAEMTFRNYQDKLIRALGGVPADFTGNLVKHTRSECEFAWGKDIKDDEMQQMIVDNLVDLVAVFSAQGHSGSSAAYLTDLIKPVMSFETLTPLKGTDDEWQEIGNLDDGGLMYQNKRDSRVFRDSHKDYSEDYFIDGKIFIEEDGCGFTSYDSRVLIDSYPYTPTSEYVYIDSEGNPVDKETS